MHGQMTNNQALALSMKFTASPTVLTWARSPGPAELSRPAKGVALPERQLAGLTGRRSDQHLIVGDVLDPP